MQQLWNQVEHHHRDDLTSGIANGIPNHHVVAPGTGLPHGEYDTRLRFENRCGQMRPVCGRFREWVSARQDPGLTVDEQDIDERGLPPPLGPQEGLSGAGIQVL